MAFAPFVTSLSLHHFRNYASVQLATNAQAIVLTGHNGAGKTNILEALSLLSAGRGLRYAPLESLNQNNAPSPFAIRAHITQPDAPICIATGIQMNAHHRWQRLVRVDDCEQPSQTTLQEYLSVQWLVPKLDRLFVDSSIERRRFFDRLVYAFERDHLRHLQRYEHYRKEWANLVQQAQPSATWVESLEASIATHATAIAAARQRVTTMINVQPHPSEHFPRVRLAWEGALENLDNDNTRQAHCRQSLAQARARYQREGTLSLDGVHRSDLLAFYQEKNMPAALCSTGEQKALLVALILASIALQSDKTGCLPILLFDEIAAHFDATRRAALFEAIRQLGCQAWYTGTESTLFRSLEGQADFFTVDNGHITSTHESLDA